VRCPSSGPIRCHSERFVCTVFASRRRWRAVARGFHQTARHCAVPAGRSRAITWSADLPFRRCSVRIAGPARDQSRVDEFCRPNHVCAHRASMGRSSTGSH
jgi:hypothetical protein